MLFNNETKVLLALDGINPNPPYYLRPNGNGYSEAVCVVGGCAALIDLHVFLSLEDSLIFICARHLVQQKKNYIEYK